MSTTDFKFVETQAIELHERWMTYCGLFGSAPRRDLLNDSGEAFFALTAELYREGILSSLFRLTDKPTTGPQSNPQSNVTVKILPDICPQIKSNLDD